MPSSPIDSPPRSCDLTSKDGRPLPPGWGACLKSAAEILSSRIVITGIGLTAPNGNNLADFRKSLLTGKSGVRKFETRYMGEVLAGICDFDELKYQKKKELRRGTRAGSIAIYCSNEALADSGIAFP